MTIRLATEADLNQIYKLYSTLLLEMSRLQPESYCAASPSPELILFAIHDRNADLLLACEAQQILGFAFLKEHATPPFPCFIPKKFVYLMDLMVDPAARGKGIGTALLQGARNWGNARGLAYVELNVLAQNAHAARLYTRAGFVENRTTMQCPCTPVQKKEMPIHE